MTISEPTVYIDFLCPWAYRGSMWLAEVERAGRIRPQVRFFSLSQNHQAREGTTNPPVWERDPQAKGLPAFLAATHPRAGGGDPAALPRPPRRPPRHEDHLPLDEHATHRIVAEHAGLDVARWE